MGQQGGVPFRTNGEPGQDRDCPHLSKTFGSAPRADRTKTPPGSRQSSKVLVAPLNSSSTKTPRQSYGAWGINFRWPPNPWGVLARFLWGQRAEGECGRAQTQATSYARFDGLVGQAAYTRNTGVQAPGPLSDGPSTSYVFLPGSPLVDPWGIFALLFGLAGMVVLFRRGNPDKLFQALAFIFFLCAFVHGLVRFLQRLG